MNLFVKNISQLLTVASHGRKGIAGRAMREPGILTDAGVLCREGKIAWVGKMNEWKERLPEDFPEFDAGGSAVLPGFVDSHTHAVFAGSRADEFARRAEGATYLQIAGEGGGILSTVAHVRAASKKQLKGSAAAHLNEMLRHGTTTVEIKSGYGLDPDAEVKLLEAINELKDEEIIGVVPTFLGAHAVPPEYAQDRQAYIDLIVGTMMPYIGRKHLARFCDVFCEKGFFEAEEAGHILAEGKRWGMEPKVHADELSASGGAELAAKVGAVSADHLECTTARGIDALREAGVVATVLPGVSFFLDHGYAPARALIDAGVPLALATDFNPGSCMSFSMPLMMTIACTHMKLTPEEALAAATLNGAAALGMSSTIGSIEVGKDADMVVAAVPDYRFLAYHFGMNHIRKTIKGGVIFEF